ncbi:MAG: flagellin [Phycisphaeraceae bacterium]
MSSLPPIFTRSTSLQASDNLLAHLQRTNARLAEAQEQIATGRQVNRPSDAAARTPAILMLRQQLAAATQQTRDLDQARTTLNRVDHALDEANTILIDAHNHALGAIGLGADATTRQAAAEEINAAISAMLGLANTNHQGIPLFGGTTGDDRPFESFLGGIRYRGNADSLTLDPRTLADQPLNATGSEAFGSLSARVVSPDSLQPQAVAVTRIADVNGATDRGVNRGHIRLTVDGQATTVDLTDADTLGDVVNRINSAIDAVDPTAGQLGFDDQGFELTANAGHTITIEDPTAGTTAQTLGLRLDATAAAVTGPGVNPRLADTTRLADLGVPIDLASGLTITQGEHTKVADFSAAQTIEDLRNTVADLNLGVRLEINDDATGLALVSEVSGLELSIGENGGTTATDLGLRSLGANTRLDDFRGGLGVETVAGETDIAVTLKNGTRFEVDLDAVQTVGELAAALEQAADDAGLAIPGDFNVGFAATGNGIVVEDHTAGGDPFTIESINAGQAAEHLGLAQETTGNTIDSGDQAQVRVESVFTHLIELRDALERNDESGIAVAGTHLEDDLDSLGLARARVGIQSQRVDQARERLEDQTLIDEAMLSELQDTDVAEVITRFLQLQQQLQATLQAGAQNLQMSFLDFMR